MDFGMLLGIAGVIGFLGCLIWLIVRAIQWDSKWPAVLGMVLCVALFFVGVAISEPSDSSGDKSPQEPQAQKDDGEEKPPEEDPPEELNLERIVYDENDIKITFLGFKEKEAPSLGYDIKLRIENNSEINYTVQVRDLSVNNIMADSIFSSDVVAGKTAYDSIWVINMEERGIEGPISSAEFKFHVFKSDFSEDGITSDTINIP